MRSLAYLLSLSLAAAPLLVGFYFMYKLLLANDGRFRLNRVLLAVIPPLTLGALPLVRFITSLFHTSRLLPTSRPGVISIVASGCFPSPAEWILWVYAAGIAVTLLLTIVTYLRIARIIARGTKHSQGRYTVVVTDSAKIVPFSWLRYIVVPRKDYDSTASVIILHEQCHLRHYHWLDLVVSQLVVIVNWFNPAAWLLREELKSVHEFQADRAVITSGADTRQYQMLLVAKAMGSRFPSLANSLNHSSLKRRIDMMLSPRKRHAIGVRVTLTVVIALIAGSIILTPQAKAYLNSVHALGIRPAVVDRDTEGITILLNGKEISNREMSELNTDQIRSITVHKAQAETENTVISIQYEDK